MKINRIEISDITKLDMQDVVRANILIASNIAPPSTIGYHLGLCVIEHPNGDLSITKRNLAFEGNLTGGGCNESKHLAQVTKLQGIKVDAWVVDIELLDKIENDNANEQVWYKILRDYEYLSSKASTDAEFIVVYKNFIKLFNS